MKRNKFQPLGILLISVILLLNVGCPELDRVLEELAYMYGSEETMGFGVIAETNTGVIKEISSEKFVADSTVGATAGSLRINSESQVTGASLFTATPVSEGNPLGFLLRANYDPVTCEVEDFPTWSPASAFKPVNSSSIQIGRVINSQLTPAVGAGPNADALFAVGPSGPKANDLVKWNLSPTGNVPGGNTPVVIVPANEFFVGGTVARGGGMAVVTSAPSGATTWKIRIQRLRNGRRVEPPVTLSIPVFSGFSPDITDPIDTVSSATENVRGQARVRYLVYRIFRNVNQPTQQSQILIQTIDDATAQPIGLPRPLTNFVKALLGGAEAAQSLAISPTGRFLLYTLYSSACKKQIILAQLLNRATGTKVKGPKIIVKCGQLPPGVGAYGLDCDVLPAEETSSSRWQRSQRAQR